MLVKADSKVSVENTSGVRLFANITTKGVPVAGDEISQSKGLSVETYFSVRNAENKKLWNELAKDSDWQVTQGNDAKISVSIKNTGNYDAENIALTLPGMEILSASEQAAVKSKYDYRDLRDDRIHYYFSLKKGEVKNFELLTNASYQGRYYQPAITVEAMYDDTNGLIRKSKAQVIADDSPSHWCANYLDAHISDDGQWRFPPLKKIPEKFKTSLITFEDKRFYKHFGIDPLAIGRALKLNFQAGRVVSGGSTISMQVIRLASQNPKRTLIEKSIEAIRALRLETRYSKDQITQLLMPAMHRLAAML
ncbi:Penicillin-binding protein 1C [Nymphon striatum]|nr:Penicillin-binding protein 1C [Nymphon striatum]